MNAIVRTVDSPIGEITLAASEEGLVLCATGGCGKELREELTKRGIKMREEHPDDEQAGAINVLNKAKRALDLFFTGEFSALLSVPLALKGTDFQLSVWRELQLIRPGDLMAYGAVAEGLGNAGAVRAVGLACRVNPLHLFVPCHRIVSADGELTGFRGGLEVKQWLLDLERSPEVQEPQFAAA